MTAYREYYYHRDDTETASSSGYVKQAQLFYSNHPTNECWCFAALHVQRQSGTGVQEGSVTFEDADLYSTNQQLTEATTDWNCSPHLINFDNGYDVSAELYVRSTS